MYFQILGPLEAENNGLAVPLGSPKQRQVLALLLASANRMLSIERVVEDLWPGDTPKTARHTVQAYVHRLRGGLGDEAERLETRAQGYRLRVSTNELDALRFEELVGKGRSEASAREASDFLSMALDLWRGSVLADIPDLASLQPERARLETMRAAALEDRIEADLSLGRHHDLIAELEAAVAEHPYRERFWGQLMLALYRSGRQAEALRAYQRARTILGEGLGISPGPWLVELEGRILLQDPTLSSPDTKRPPPVRNIPVARTTFVGRDVELGLVQGILHRTPLVTITGPPGVGKTRLAMEVAGEAQSHYPHGVCFVSLDEIDDPLLLAATIAGRLGLQASDRDSVEALFGHLRPRRMLLVLDNFEHLIDAADMVARLVDAAPGIAILATSRVPLRLAGEHVFRLDPLPPPEPGELAAELMANPAVTLFEERARAVNHGFRVTDSNFADVVSVVNRLDRLPLAIELAAGHMGALPLGELAARLEPALPLLSRGAVDGQASHRTLTEAIAWSHDLLTPSQKAVLRRLSVFRGGFTIEHAEQIAAGPPTEAVIEDLLDLVESNLIVGPATLGDSRFSFLETIREFASNALREAGEEETMARRHAEHFLALAEEAELELTGPGQTEWLDLLTTEYPNLRAALAWTSKHDPEIGLLMAGRIWRFWQFRGLLSDGRMWLEEMLEASNESGFARVKGLIGLAGICYWQTDFPTAEACYSEALRLLDGMDDPLLRAEAIFGQMQTLACAEGDIESALPLEQELHALAASNEHPELAFMDVVASGAVRYYTQDWEGAWPYMRQTLEMARMSGNRWLEREVLFGMALGFYFQGRLEEAQAHGIAALAISHEMRHMQGVSTALYWLGLMHVVAGNTERGVSLAGTAARLREEHGGGFVAEDVGLAPTQDPIDLAREVLDDTEIDRALAKGWATSYEDLVNTLTSSLPT